MRASLANFSGISNETLLGKCLRAPLRLIPRSTAIPIVQGPLRGKKWIVGSSNHGCWLGSFEHDKQRQFQKAIPRKTLFMTWELMRASTHFLPAYSLVKKVTFSRSNHSRTMCATCENIWKLTGSRIARSSTLP
jgi:hypothetical protein